MRRSRGFLFLLSLVLSLWLAHLPAKIPTTYLDATQLVEQGIALYEGRIKDAIASGQLLNIYQQAKNPLAAIVQESAIADEQIGTGEQAVNYWTAIAKGRQAGCIFKARSQYSELVKADEQAIATIDRDTVDPIYRLTELKLEQASLPSIQKKQRNQILTSALTTIDLLKLVELQNYFGNECVSIPQAKVDLAQLDSATAIFSSIILKDRTAILVSLPNGEKRSAWIDINSKNFRELINKYRRGLERYRDFDYDPRQAQQLYDWIIRPFASDLETLQIKTLVFIQDGILRTVPMAALHDGKKFLVQKYAIATTPSLTLTVPRKLNRKRRVLALGLTKQATVDGRRFPALTNVEKEIKQIQAQIPDSKQLLDENFTRDRLQQELSKTAYSIIHIATHGEIGMDPKESFLVTGNNGKLTITDLDTTIRSIKSESDAVELLFLTACQTAVGDDRAILGLAGVAVGAGVRSALATLWFIQDAPTVTLVTQFYNHWHKLGASKAQALQASQQALIEAGGQYTHPAYWAGFILIGDWL